MATPSQTNIPDQESDNDWFFDIIINFLRSPRWKTPIMQFLDENCIIFDNEEENRLEYTSIHMSFKKIVDDLLSELMRELGVTEDQFMEACEKAAANPLHKKIVDQITAVENFTAFKKLMVKRNQELNQQAMQMMSKKEEVKDDGQMTANPQSREPKTKAKAQGTISQQTLPTPKMSKEQKEAFKIAQEEESKAEEEMVRKAMEISMQLDQQMKQEIDEEEEMIKRVMELSEQEEKLRQKKLREEEDNIKRIAEQEAGRQAEEERIRKAEEETKKQMVQAQQKIKEQEEVKVQVQAQVEFSPQEQHHDAAQTDMIKPQKKQRLPKQELEKTQSHVQPPTEKIQSKLPDIQKQKTQFDLPPVQMKRGGGFDFDNDILIEQQKNINKMNAMREFDEMEDQQNKKHGQEESKSLSDMLKEKREKNEQFINSKQPTSQQESVEDRKKRLQAQRDILMKQKADKRGKELEEFKEKTNNQQDLHKELLELDKKTKLKAQAKVGMQFGSSPSKDNFDEINLNDHQEVDKRLKIYENMRQEILKVSNQVREAGQHAKMKELETKIQKLEVVKREREEQERQEEEKKRKELQQRENKSKNFLENIKSYSIEDI